MYLVPVFIRDIRCNHVFVEKIFIECRLFQPFIDVNKARSGVIIILGGNTAVRSRNVLISDVTVCKVMTSRVLRRLVVMVTVPLTTWRPSPNKGSPPLSNVWPARI